jgi:ubiquinone/menaquinone biosynthesis C-methylase UbiE
MLTEFSLKMLNGEAASPKNKSLKIIKNLNIENGMVVVDLGSGGGYFAHEFSRKVGENGMVYAIDVNKKALDFISHNIEKEGIKNAKTLLGNFNGVNLPEKSIDLIFLRNVFHHLSGQEEYFRNIKKILKDDGKIAIIDYKKKGFSLSGLLGHYTPENKLLDIMGRAGFSSLQKFDFLPNQLFMTFGKKQ